MNPAAPPSLCLVTGCNQCFNPTLISASTCVCGHLLSSHRSQAPLPTPAPLSTTPASVPQSLLPQLSTNQTQTSRPNGLILIEMTSRDIMVTLDPNLMFAHAKPKQYQAFSSATKKAAEAMRFAGQKLLQMEAQARALGYRYGDETAVKAALLYAHGFPCIDETQPFDKLAFTMFMNKFFNVAVPEVKHLNIPKPSGHGQTSKPELNVEQNGLLEEAILANRIVGDLPDILGAQFPAPVTILSHESNARFQLEAGLNHPPLLKRYMVALERFQYDDAVTGPGNVETSLLFKLYCPSWPALPISEPRTASSTFFRMRHDPQSLQRQRPAQGGGQAPDPGADYLNMPCLVKDCLPLMYSLWKAGHFGPLMPGGLVHRA